MKQPKTPSGEIAHPALLERIALNNPLTGYQYLDPRKYDFLQQRVGRDERPDLFQQDVQAGIEDFWERFQLPFALNAETLHLDEQVIKGVVEELMSFNGWAAAACSSLIRPFAANKHDEYADLTSSGQLYYFALVVHSADHFLIDQLAVIVQLARRLGPTKVFVSLVDYASTDSTPFLCDMSEMVLTLLGISFRIRRVPPMTMDPTASYYPNEEAYTRNLALEPLMELYHRRHLKFARVIWLKGFACPTDILETLRIGDANKAAMTCSMDWKEHNGFFIYNDRWRTRDLEGNLFRGSKSTAPLDEAPPRDPAALDRYSQHLPFQVFCCESGVHIVDPTQTYYSGLRYRSSVENNVFNLTSAGDTKAPKWSEGPCMDSSQMHFCRDIWMLSARKGVEKFATEAKQRERKGLQRALSDEWEAVIKAVVPHLAMSVAGNADFARGREKAIEDLTEAGLSNDEEGFELEEEEEADPNAAEKKAQAAEQQLKQEQNKAADAAAAALSPEEQARENPVDEADLKNEVVDESSQHGALDEPDAVAAIGEDAQEPKVPAEEPKKPAADQEDAQPNEAIPGPPIVEAAEEKPEVANEPAPAIILEEGDEAEDGLQAEAIKAEDLPVENAPLDKNEGIEPEPIGQPQVIDPNEFHLVDDEAARAGVPAAAFQRGAEAAAAAAAQAAAEQAEAQQQPPQRRKKRSMSDAEFVKRASAILPNSAFDAARIIVNPRCVTTYAGVSHTQLAMDLFGSADSDEIDEVEGGKYALDETDWRHAPETFVCQEVSFYLVSQSKA